jgi:hypothetical protein
VLKEVYFEVHGDQAREPVIACILHSKTLVSETLSFAADDACAWQLNSLRGDEREVAVFREVLNQPLEPPVTERLEEVQGGSNWLAYYWQWRKPKPGEAVSIEHLFREHLGGRGSLKHRVGPGKGEFVVQGFDADALARLYREAEQGFQERYDVRLVRMGEAKLGPPGHAHGDLGSEDLLFAREAMRLGYFEEPRRIGVRELGGLVGSGKSATAHRLRRIERRAVQRLLSEAMVPGPSCSGEGRAREVAPRMPPSL